MIIELYIVDGFLYSTNDGYFHGIFNEFLFHLNH